jgi:hypothetical protein
MGTAQAQVTDKQAEMARSKTVEVIENRASVTKVSINEFLIASEHSQPPALVRKEVSKRVTSGSVKSGSTIGQASKKRNSISPS